MGKLFGTDGVRGVANADLTPELVFRLGRAVAVLLAGRAAPGGRAAPSGGDGRGRAARGGRPTLLVGRDTRLSGDLLESALAAGVASAGVDVSLLGVMTTPGVACLTRRRAGPADVIGGAVISASHNPAEYNGVKFFSPEGFKLPDEVEERVEALAVAGGAGDAGGAGEVRPTGSALGRIRRDPGAAADYVQFLGELVPDGLRGVKVVLDCANGAASEVAPAAFRRLGAQVAVINDRPDGLNINAGCGSLHPAGLQEAVLRERATAGLAFDGDADRVIAVDEKGGVVDGDQIMAVAAEYLSARGALTHDTVVATVMSNLGLERALARRGIRLVRTRVGDRHVLEEMLRGGYTLGGEQSGHIIFLDRSTTGDGILTGIRLMQMIAAFGRPFSELAGQVVKYPQHMVNVRVRDRGIDGNERIRAVLAAAERELGGTGRILVRPSGTEPLVRVMVEGEDQNRVRAMAEDLASAISRELNGLSG